MIGIDDVASSSPQSPPVARRLKWRRLAKRLLIVLAVVYVLGAVVLYFAQSLLIYPGAYIDRHQDVIVIPAPDREVLKLHTPDGQRIAAVFGAAQNSDGSARSDAASCPTILFFYGNGDCIATSMGLFGDFRRLGANVLIPEYVGYPMSSGRPSEQGCCQTADAAYAYLLSRHDVDPKQIVIVGRSIGSGPAIDLASRKPVAALATFSAFTSMDEMAQKVVPVYPTGLFLRTHFNNAAKIADVKCPIFMAHGTADNFVPFAMMARVAQKAKAPVTIVPVQSADHNNLFDVGGTALLNRFGAFLNSVRSGGPDNDQAGRK